MLVLVLRSNSMAELETSFGSGRVITGTDLLATKISTSFHMALPESRVVCVWTPYCKPTIVLSNVMGQPICVVLCVRIVLRVVVVAILILQVALILATPLVVILVVGAAHHKPLLIVCCPDLGEVVRPCAAGPLLEGVELQVAPELD